MRISIGRFMLEGVAWAAFCFLGTWCVGGCAQGEPLDLTEFAPAEGGTGGVDAGNAPDSMAACRTDCYADCLPNAKDDLAVRDCVWTCAESCAQDGWSPTDR